MHMRMYVCMYTQHTHSEYDRPEWRVDVENKGAGVWE